MTDSMCFGSVACPSSVPDEWFSRLFSSSLLVTKGKETRVLCVTPDTLLCFAHSLESIRQCGVALCIVLGFSILSASLGSSVVRDRVTGAKRLQHISGLGYRTYWLTNFLYDMVGFGNNVPCASCPWSVCVRVCVHACECRKRPPHTVPRRRDHFTDKNLSACLHPSFRMAS